VGVELQETAQSSVQTALCRVVCPALEHTAGGPSPAESAGEGSPPFPELKGSRSVYQSF